MTIPPERLTNLLVNPLMPEETVETNWVDPSRLWVSLNFPPETAFTGTGYVAQVCFLAVLNQGSAIIPMPLSDLSGRKIDGSSLTSFGASLGRVIVVSNTPVLGSVGIVEGQVKLAIYGRPGVSYYVETSMSVLGPWFEVGSVTCTDVAQPVIWTDQMQDAARFYRLREY
jgi:hypothetical protein